MTVTNFEVFLPKFKLEEDLCVILSLTTLMGDGFKFQFYNVSSMGLPFRFQCGENIYYHVGSIEHGNL